MQNISLFNTITILGCIVIRYYNLLWFLKQIWHCFCCLSLFSIVFSVILSMLQLYVRDSDVFLWYIVCLQFKLKTKKYFKIDKKFKKSGTNNNDIRESIFCQVENIIEILIGNLFVQTDIRGISCLPHQLWRPQLTEVCPSEDLKATCPHHFFNFGKNHAATFRGKILFPSAPTVASDPLTCGRRVRVLLLFHSNDASEHNASSVLYFPISTPSDLLYYSHTAPSRP